MSERTYQTMQGFPDLESRVGDLGDGSEGFIKMADDWVEVLVFEEHPNTELILDFSWRTQIEVIVSKNETLRNAIAFALDELDREVNR